jgi:hypothetical protein
MGKIFEEDELEKIIIRLQTTKKVLSFIVIMYHMVACFSNLYVALDLISKIK